MEVPHIEGHNNGINALKAKEKGDHAAMLRHDDAMEKASFAVIECLERMAAA
ncbi:MAG: hypothetical protein ABTQ25_19260 [Nitrosomonas ureae]